MGLIILPKSRDLYISIPENSQPTFFGTMPLSPFLTIGSLIRSILARGFECSYRFCSIPGARVREKLRPECHPMLFWPTCVPEDLCLSNCAASFLIFSKVFYELPVVLYAGPFCSILHFLNFFVSFLIL